MFLPDAIAVGAEKCRLAAEAGLEGAFPLDAQLDIARLPPAEQARRISLANEGLMRSCDGLVANLTPFRGVSMDSAAPPSRSASCRRWAGRWRATPT